MLLYMLFARTGGRSHLLRGLAREFRYRFEAIKHKVAVLNRPGHVPMIRVRSLSQPLCHILWIA